ncbi:6610_t:CDS:2, partial [Racocetra persica]
SNPLTSSKWQAKFMCCPGYNKTKLQAKPGANLAFLEKNMALFCKEFNDKTKDKDGQIVSVEINVYDDKSYSYNISTPPSVYLLKNRQAELEEIARKLMPSLNTDDIEKAKKIVR